MPQGKQELSAAAVNEGHKITRKKNCFWGYLNIPVFYCLPVVEVYNCNFMQL